MAIPSQYRNFQTPPVGELANLSPLQLALIHYMRDGQEVPFFINHDWLRALTTFADSGIIAPADVGGFGPVIIDDTESSPQIYTIEPKPDCGPDETDRYENVRVDAGLLKPDMWVGSIDQLVRGGSVCDGAGGPWGTGGLSGPNTSPDNGVDLPPPIYANAVSQFGFTNTSSPLSLQLNEQASIVLAGRTETNGVPAKTETEIAQELFQNNIPVYVQGIT